MNFVRVSDAQFDLDTISWVTPRLAVTDMNGAQTVFGEEEFFALWIISAGIIRTWELIDVIISTKDHNEKLYQKKTAILPRRKK